MQASDVDEAISTYLKQLTTSQKQILARKLAKQQLKRSKPSVCRPREKPLTAWVPKDVEKAKTVLSLLLDGNVGLVSNHIQGNEYDFKLMSSELAAAATGTIHADAAKSALAASSMLVSALLSRIMEGACQIKDEEQVKEAKMQMQGHRSTANLGARSRGSGLACNHAGFALVKRAAAELRDRLSQ